MIYMARPGGLTTGLVDRIEAGLLRDGDVGALAAHLGRSYQVVGEVIHGKKLGRKLGFPTANMKLAPRHPLRAGIYAVQFRDGAGNVSNGVASFGCRPTVHSDGSPLLEVHIFDFDGDLYGQICSVAFIRYLRPELKFDSLDSLVEQMKLDEVDARKVLCERSRPTLAQGLAP